MGGVGYFRVVGGWFYFQMRYFQGKGLFVGWLLRSSVGVCLCIESNGVDGLYFLDWSA